MHCTIYKTDGSGTDSHFFSNHAKARSQPRLSPSSTLPAPFIPQAHRLTASQLSNCLWAVAKLGWVPAGLYSHSFCNGESCYQGGGIPLFGVVGGAGITYSISLTHEAAII